MGKELAKRNEEAIASLIRSDNTGIDMGAVSFRPGKLKILQSDKQDKFFEEDTEISNKDYGQMFISLPDVKIKKDELKTSIEGILMRYSLGYTVFEKGARDDDMDKNVGSGSGVIGVTGVMTKEEFERKYPDLGYRNQGKIIFALGTAEEALETLSFGGNPFVQLELSKSSYGVTFSFFGKMAKALQENDEWKKFLAQEKEKGGVSKPTANAYRIKITTEEAISQKGLKFYIPNIQISMNTVEEAQMAQPLFNMWKDRALFGKFGQDLSSEAETAEVERVFSEIDKTEPDHDDEDYGLPF